VAQQFIADEQATLQLLANAMLPRSNMSDFDLNTINSATFSGAPNVTQL
jgi:hypothetical protein